jgi:hypothetical protein
MIPAATAKAGLPDDLPVLGVAAFAGIGIGSCAPASLFDPVILARNCSNPTFALRIREMRDIVKFVARLDFERSTESLTQMKSRAH